MVLAKVQDDIDDDDIDYTPGSTPTFRLMELPGTEDFLADLAAPVPLSHPSPRRKWSSSRSLKSDVASFDEEIEELEAFAFLVDAPLVPELQDWRDLWYGQWEFCIGFDDFEFHYGPRPYSPNNFLI